MSDDVQRYMMYYDDLVPDDKGTWIRLEDYEALRAELNAREGVISDLRSQLAAHRKYLEFITDDGTDYPADTMEDLIDLGLIVEAPPTPDFIEERGDDCEMYVLAWSPLAPLTRRWRR